MVSGLGRGHVSAPQDPTHDLEMRLRDAVEYGNALAEELRNVRIDLQGKKQEAYRLGKKVEMLNENIKMLQDRINELK